MACPGREADSRVEEISLREDSLSLLAKFNTEIHPKVRMPCKWEEYQRLREWPACLHSFSQLRASGLKSALCLWE